MYWRYYVRLVANFNAYECLISDRRNTHAANLWKERALWRNRHAESELMQNACEEIRLSLG